MRTKSDEIRSGSSYSSFIAGKDFFHKITNSFKWFAWRPPDEHDCMYIKRLGMIGAFCFQTEARMEINLHMIPEDTFGENRTSVLFKRLADQEYLEIDKCSMRGLGKSASKNGSWNRSITSMWGCRGLQPWPPPCSLRTSCLSGRGVVLWTWVHSIKGGRSSSVEGVHEREI